MAKRGSQTTRKMFVSQITTRGVGSFLQDKSLSNFGDYENAHVFQTPSRMTRQDEAKEPAGNSQKVQNFMKNQTNENLINFKKMLKQKISNSVHKGRKTNECCATTKQFHNVFSSREKLIDYFQRPQSKHNPKQFIEQLFMDKDFLKRVIRILGKEENRQKIPVTDVLRWIKLITIVNNIKIVDIEEPAHEAKKEEIEQLKLMESKGKDTRELVKQKYFIKRLTF